MPGTYLYSCSWKFSFSFFSFFLGEVLGFENLVFSVFEFIHGLIETPKFKKTVKKFLDELIYFLVLYMQITEDQVRIVLLKYCTTLSPVSQEYAGVGVKREGRGWFSGCMYSVISQPIRRKENISRLASTFSRSCQRLHVFASRSDWLIWISSCIVIGQSYLVLYFNACDWVENLAPQKQSRFAIAKTCSHTPVFSR